MDLALPSAAHRRSADASAPLNQVPQRLLGVAEGLAENSPVGAWIGEILFRQPPEILICRLERVTADPTAGAGGQARGKGGKSLADSARERGGLFGELVYPSLQYGIRLQRDPTIGIVEALPDHLLGIGDGLMSVETFRQLVAERSDGAIDSGSGKALLTALTRLPYCWADNRIGRERVLRRAGHAAHMIADRNVHALPLQQGARQLP